jgi:hypothetical protein
MFYYLFMRDQEEGLETKSLAREFALGALERDLEPLLLLFQWDVNQCTLLDHLSLLP